MVKRFNSEKLNEIINELLDSMEKSKNKVSTFHEVVSEDINIKERKLVEVNRKMELLDLEIKKVSIESKKYRDKLLMVSKAMAKNPEKQQSVYTETYKKANELMFEMKNLETLYRSLFEKRDNLERELIKLRKIQVDAEDLIQSISVSFKYLDDDLSDIGHHLNEKETILLKIIEAGENEKKRIVRDIHDGPAQILAYITLEIQLLKSSINSNSLEDIYNTVENVDKYTQRALEETRQIIYDLRPMSLDDLGLIPTLKNYIKEFSEKKGIHIRFRLIDEDNLAIKMPNTLSVSIFRIVQESLNNIYKHSEATEAIVNIEILDNMLKLIIIDNGKGFDVENALEKAKSNGSFGLIGMKERVDLIDGDISIVSNKNHGTKITVSIPLNSLNKKT